MARCQAYSKKASNKTKYTKQCDSEVSCSRMTIRKRQKRRTVSTIIIARSRLPFILARTMIGNTLLIGRLRYHQKPSTIPGAPPLKWTLIIIRRHRRKWSIILKSKYIKIFMREAWRLPRWKRKTQRIKSRQCSLFNFNRGNHQLQRLKNPCWSKAQAKGRLRKEKCWLSDNPLRIQQTRHKNRHMLHLQWAICMTILPRWSKILWEHFPIQVRMAQEIIPKGIRMVFFQNRVHSRRINTNLLSVRRK